MLDTLSPVLSGVLTEIVSVTINEQPEPGYLGDTSFTVNALSLQLLAEPRQRSGEDRLRRPPCVRTMIRPSRPDAHGRAAECRGWRNVHGDRRELPPNTNVTVQLNDLRVTLWAIRSRPPRMRTAASPPTSWFLRALKLAPIRLGNC